MKMRSNTAMVTFVAALLAGSAASTAPSEKALLHESVEEVIKQAATISLRGRNKHAIEDPENANGRFVQEQNDEDDCHAKHTDADDCDADPACSWCECSAIPSACYSLDEIDSLPAGVFDCHKTPSEQEQEVALLLDGLSEELDDDPTPRPEDLICMIPEHQPTAADCLSNRTLHCTWCEMADDQKGPRHKCFPLFSKKALIEHNASKSCTEEIPSIYVEEEEKEVETDRDLIGFRWSPDTEEDAANPESSFENWLGCWMMENEDDCLGSSDKPSDCSWCTLAHPVGAVVDLCEPEYMADSLVESGFASSCVSAQKPTDESEESTKKALFVGEKTQRFFSYKDAEVDHWLQDETVDPEFCDPKSPKSLSGYISLDGSKYDGPGEDKHYFYWFFESRDKDADENTPFFIWLTGGPGCSSSLALLSENGPCSVNDEGTGTTPNEFAWNNNAHALWLDQPTGVGYSYGRIDDSSETMVGENAYYFLQSFLQSHPEYSKNPLFITGESYAGHYVPAITHRILEGNKEKKDGTIHLNLQGMAIGNGLTNPEVQYPQYAEMAIHNSHNIKVLDEDTVAEMKKASDGCTELIHKCNSVNKEHPGPMEIFYCQSAMTVCNMAFMVPYQMTGLNPYDIREKCKVEPLCYDFTNVATFLNLDSTKEALHVHKDSSHWESCNNGVHSNFNTDWMKDMSPKVADILNAGLRVLVYAGDVDFICNYLGNRAWTLALDWDHKDEFNAAEDHEWNNKSGLAKTSDGFTFLQVYDAGHMVPMDQPEVSLTMINQFFKGDNF